MRENNTNKIRIPGSTGPRQVAIRSDILKERFLQCYRMLHHIYNTCRVIGMEPRTMYHWQRSDPEFKKKFKEAQSEVLDQLQDEAYRRAVLGVDKPVFQGGRLVGWTREYSDTLLVLLLKANDPAKYREQWKGELTGADGKPLVGNMQIIHVHSNTPMAESEEQIQLTKDPQTDSYIMTTGEAIPFDMMPPSKRPEERHMVPELTAKEQEDLSELLDDEEDLVG